MSNRKVKGPVRKIRRTPDCQYPNCLYFGETDVYGLCPQHNLKAHREVGIGLHVYSKTGE